MPLFRIVFYSRNHVKLVGGTMREMVRDILAACNRYDRSFGLTGGSPPTTAAAGRFGARSPRGAAMRRTVFATLPVLVH